MTYQTAYKRQFIGTILYMATMVTFFGWFALQLVCTRLLYSTDGEDLLMSLRTFIAVWVAGYFWNCSLLWPHSIKSLFLRRCTFAQATHIAVFQETDEYLGEKADQITRLPACFKIAVAKVKGIVHIYFRLLFANPDCRPDLSKGIFQFCPVFRNDDQSQYITFLLRRYNFDSNRVLFLPGSWALPKTFKGLASSIGINVMDQVEAAYYDILKEDGQNEWEEPLSWQLYKHDIQGLSTAEVKARCRVVGPNVMEIPAPSVVGIFINEIAKPFYLFQIYIVWFWATVQYVYGTFIIWTIVLMTTCIISWFRYRGSQVLHAICHVNDQATVLRDGTLVTIDQFDLVPGDVVKVTPGPIHCDMLLMTGEAVVDESALTGEATPQAKSPVEANSERIYDPAIHKRQTLSAGTSIVECDDSFALVIKTASNTTKGKLLRHVLVFRNHQIKFRSELPVVISLLTTYSAIFCVTVVISSGAGLVVGLSLGM
jgi:hypothetical protein